MVRKLSVCGSLLLLASAPAQAHFKLLVPADSIMTNAMGDPQKLGPCTPGTATNMVTKVAPGSKLKLRWRETVGHPGHYRISIGPDRAQFKDPVVTPKPGDQCGSAAIQAVPVAPTIADGLFVHATGAQNTTYDYEVTVPTTPCPNCTLQILEFMSSHGAPCFYYHCANLNITNDPGAGGAGGAGTGGVSGGAGGASGAGGGSSTGTGGTVGTGSGGTSAGGNSAGAAGGPGGANSTGAAGASAAAGSGAPMGAPDSAGGCSCRIGGSGENGGASTGLAGLLSVVGLVGLILGRSSRRILAKYGTATLFSGEPTVDGPATVAPGAEVTVGGERITNLGWFKAGGR